MVAANTTITFAVSGTTAGLVPVDATDVRSTVADRLSLYFTVLALTVKPPSWIDGIVNVEWLHWSYTASVTLKTRIAYGDIDDIRSVVANAFYIATGAMPTVSAPALGETQQLPATDYPGSGIGDALGKAADKFLSAEMIIVLGIIGVVALIAFSPAGKAIGNIRLL